MKNPIVQKTGLLLFLLVALGHSAFEPGRMPPSYLALGSSGVARLQPDFFNVNPALLVFGSQPVLKLQYRNFYNIAQLNEFALSFNSRLKGLPLGLFISQFGDKNYQEHQVSLALAIHFFKRLAVGFLFHNYFLQIKNYGHYHSMGVSAAVHLKILPWLNMASVFANFNEPTLSAQKGDIPVYLIHGLEIKVLPQARISLDLFKDERSDFDYRAGIAVQLNPMFTVLGGFRQQVHSFSSGLIFKRKIISICYALEYHPRIGLSNALSVAYFF